MDIVYGLVTFFAGLGLLLFSIKLVGEALEKTSGAKLRKSFSNMTNNKFKGLGLGLGVTLLLQSSTASMVMTVALCDVGIIVFSQTIPLIFGFNIGSSLTLLLVSFGSVKIVQILSVLTFVGAAIFIFAKNQLTKNIGRLIVGFGSLFLAITLMSNGMSVLNEKNIFNFISFVTNPFLLVPLFTAFTAVIQTSLGAAAILVTFLGTATIPGVMTVSSALWALIGINIGTSLSSFLATIGSSRNAKRAGLMHITFKVIGAIIWSILLAVLPFGRWFENSGIQPGFIVLIFDLMLAISTALILLPFTNLLYKLIMKIFPDRKTGGKDKSLIKVDENILATPTIALGSFIAKTKEVYALTTQKIVESFEFVVSQDPPKTAVVLRDCMEIEKVFGDIEENLLKISAGLSETDQSKTKQMLQIIKRSKDLTKTIKKIIRFVDGGEKVAASDLENIKVLTDQVRLMIIATQTAINIIDMDLLIEREPLVVRVFELDSELAAKTTLMKDDALKKIKTGHKKVSSFASLSALLDIFERFGEYLRSISVIVSQ